MNRSIVILLAMSFAAVAILFVVLEMWKLKPRPGGHGVEGARGDISAPADAARASRSAAAAGSGSGASAGDPGRREELGFSGSAQFRVRLIDIHGAVAPGATLFAQGATTIEQTGDDFDVKGTIPLVLVAQAPGFAGPVLRTVDAPPKGIVYVHLFREVRISVELTQSPAGAIPNDRGYLAIIGGATTRQAIAIDGAITKVEVTAPEGECQLCFVGERLASAPVNAILQAGSQIPLALAKRPAGTVRVRIDAKGFAPPKLTFPLAPADLAASDPMTPVAVREATTSDGDLFVFEEVPAGAVTASADDSANERSLRASATLAADATIELVLH